MKLIQDFHYTIQDVITEGSLVDGRAAVRSSITGKWVKKQRKQITLQVKAVGETPATNEDIVINSVTLCTFKNGKTTELWIMTTQPPHWKAAWDKFLSAMAKA